MMVHAYVDGKPVGSWQTSAAPVIGDVINIDLCPFMVDQRIWTPQTPGYEWTLVLHGHWNPTKEADRG
jgi:hypothetical protein